MRIECHVDPRQATATRFAVVRLRAENGADLGQLDVEYSRLLPLGRPGPLALDLLLLASAVYAIDKLVARSTAGDGWTRDFELRVPASDPGRWSGAANAINECLSFLTGDRWTVEFSELRSRLARPGGRRRRGVRRPAGESVCLFSGGLDSLVGTIDHLEEHGDERVLLIGHHDGQMPGPLSDQRALLPLLMRAYPDRVSAVLPRVGHSGTAQELTLRGRSLVFVALGVFAAAAQGEGTPVLIPENGTIALNPPLTPARRGSCSTRTAHPHYLDLLRRVLSTIGLDHPLSNPLAQKTKGEVVVGCRNRELVHSLAQLTVSCAKRGHTRNWPNRTAGSCGCCMPCIYRRAALHAAGLDTEPYGADICSGEVDLDNPGLEAPNDLRAFLSFLRAEHSAQRIGSMLLANGSLDPGRVPESAALVRRTMEEVQALLRAKATPEVRRRAGIRD